MNTSASVNDAEDAGLSVLDVVKHAVNTITQSLNSYDRLSVVTFSDSAKVLFSNVQMNAAGKVQAKSSVDALRTEGRTNLWAGLLKGMDILQTSSNGQRNTSLFLLTDGVPNVNPEGGHICAMQCFKDQNGGHYPGSIHTFGFGYSLQSALLNDIALEGSGTYNFIPDSGFVGTAFVNTLANQLTAYGTQTTLSLQLLDEDCTLVEHSLPSNGSHMITSWGVNINVGSLLFGQQRDMVVQVQLPVSAEASMSTPLLEAVLKYKPLFVPPSSAASSAAALNEEGDICVSQTELDVTEYGALNLEVQLFRASLVQDLTTGYSVQSTATAPEVTLRTAMQAWHDDAQAIVAVGDETPATAALLAYVAGLLEDLTGQIRMANSQLAHFNKWGVHYLPSLRCAHQRQQCNNFKDPGVQHYGGELFRSLRDTAEEVFLSLPPPKPSRLNRSSRPNAPVNMSAYHNASAGCFAGSGRVTMADGVSTKLVCDLRRGDLVQTTCGDGSGSTHSVTVDCVVRTQCSLTSSAELVMMPNGLLLTPWHPLWHEGSWKFPMDIVGSSQEIATDYVYNFVLGLVLDKGAEAQQARSEGGEGEGQRGQSIMVDGVQCITLAHGIEKDAVATHAFYGTGQVLQSLQQYDQAGYAEGLVVMTDSHVQRSKDSGLVCGFAQQQREEEEVAAE